MRSVWSNIVSLILLILLAPVLLIIVGPLLALAALRGRQPAGPITFDTTRSGLGGRAGALLLGLVLWLLIWSGLAWVALNGLAPLPPTVAETLSATLTPTPTRPAITASPTLTPAPGSATVAFTPTLSLRPSSTASSTPGANTPPPTTTPARLTTTATNTPTATATNRPTVTVTYTITPSFTPSPTATLNAAGLRPLPRLSIADQRRVIATMAEGNDLLREAIMRADEENIQNLRQVWQGRAFTKAETFAVEHYDRYAKPLQVQFEYIHSPQVSEQSTANQVVVFSQEKWRYGSPEAGYSESFEFIYTLSRQDGSWAITSYTYRNLPDNQPTVTPRSSNAP